MYEDALDRYHEAAGAFELDDDDKGDGDDVDEASDQTIRRRSDISD